MNNGLEIKKREKEKGRKEGFVVFTSFLFSLFLYFLLLDKKEIWGYGEKRKLTIYKECPFNFRNKEGETMPKVICPYACKYNRNGCCVTTKTVEISTRGAPRCYEDEEWCVFADCRHNRFRDRNEPRCMNGLGPFRKGASCPECFTTLLGR